MKKIIFLLLILAGYSGFSQISVRTQTTPTQLTAGNGTVVVRSGSVSVTTSTVSLLPTLLTNTTTAMKKGIDTLNQSLRYGLVSGANTAISRLNDIYTSVYGDANIQSSMYYNGVLTYDKYSTNKLDSLIDIHEALNTYTVMTFTVTSANTNSAVSGGQSIGNGTYSITIPSGKWQVLGATCTHSLQSSTSVIRMYFYQGATNIATQAEGSTYSVGSMAAMDELLSIYSTNTTAYQSVVWSSTGAFSTFLVQGLTSNNLSANEILSSGTLKIGFCHGASYTPPLNPQYIIKIKLKKVSL